MKDTYNQKPSVSGPLDNVSSIPVDVTKSASTGSLPLSPSESTKRRGRPAKVKSGAIPDGKKSVRAGERLSRHLVREIFKKKKAPLFVRAGSNWYCIGRNKNAGWILSNEKEARCTVNAFISENFPWGADKTTVDEAFQLLQYIWKIADDNSIRVWRVRNNPETLRLVKYPAGDRLPFVNVILNLKTFRTRPYSEEFFTVGRVPCCYDETAVSTLWKQYLDGTLSLEAQILLQEMFGASLSWERDLHAFFVLYGKGGNGKSVALKVLEEINSGAVSVKPFSKFGGRFDNLDLTVNRVNIASDSCGVSRDDIILVEEILKAASSGESIDVEAKNAKSEKAKSSALLVFAMNPPLPRLFFKKEGIGRRIRVIPFDKTIVGTSKENPQLVKELINELPGIVNWALVGLNRLRARGAAGFSKCEAGINALHEAEKQVVPEIRFFEECLVFNADIRPGAEVPNEWKIAARKLYLCYKGWYENQHFRITTMLPQPNFSEAVGNYFTYSDGRHAKSQAVRIGEYNGRGFTGIQIRTEAEIWSNYPEME